MEELNTLFENRPQGIDLSSETKAKPLKQKGESEMSFMANLGKVVVVAVLAGGGIAGGLYFAGAAHNAEAMSNEPLSVTINDELLVLAEIKEACFPLIGKRKRHCKLYLRHYRAMEKYAYSDSDLFNDEPAKEAKEGENDVKGKTQGNG